MYYFVIHSLPGPDADLPTEARGAAGAYVRCWIDFKDLDGAAALARHYIAGAGWIPEEPDPEQTRCREREDYLDDELGLQYFDEAVETGVCLSFHVYPADDDDPTA